MAPIPLLSGRTTAVLTASDRCFAGTQTDRSGPALQRSLEEHGARVLDAILAPDDLPILVGHLHSLAATGVHLILTTGGTGMAPRDNTPEATRSVSERIVPGLAELIRQEGARDTPFSWLSRGVCAISGSSLIVNLPGSPAGAVRGLLSILHLLPHALDLVSGHTEHALLPGEPESGTFPLA